MTIQFICRGNVFRSIIAETYVRSLALPGVTVRSHGIVAARDKEQNRAGFSEVMALLERRGVSRYAKDHYGDNTTQKLLDRCDVTVFLNEIAHKEAVGLFAVPDTALVWAVSDFGEHNKVPTSKEDRLRLLDETYDEIIDDVDRLLSQLKLR
jgi:protein-tyrosine-phosphatase